MDNLYGMGRKTVPGGAYPHNKFLKKTAVLKMMGSLMLSFIRNPAVIKKPA